MSNMETSTEMPMMTSLYIPIIGKDITEEYVIKCFHDNNIGKVSHVDFVLNKEKKLRREAFVHFSEWYHTEQANQLKSQLDIAKATCQRCQILHNGTNYWPLLLNKNPLEKNSPLKKPNNVYEFEERILYIERQMEKLSFMTKVHDANIRYILRNGNEDMVNNNPLQVKRMKTDLGGYVYTMPENVSS